MDDRPLYRVLEVPRDASAEDVKRAYKRLALRLHPDKNGGDAAAAEEFKSVNEAYAVLGDAERREAYDRFGPKGGPSAGFRGGGAGGFVDIEQMFGNMFSFSMGHQQPQRPPCDLMEVEITPRELYEGCVKHVEYSAPDKCAQCGGTGAASPEDITSCIACGGSGTFTPPGMMIFGGGGPPCPACSGKGRAFRTVRRCAGCAGAGTCTAKRRTIGVRLPPGVPDGFSQLLQGKGGFDPRAGAHRDLAVRIRRRPMPPGCLLDASDGSVTLTVPVSLEDVLCGFKAAVDVFDGAASVEVGAEAYAWPGRTVEIPRMGLPPGGGPGERGLLRIRFDVQFPRDEHVTAANLVRYRDVLRRAMEGQPEPPV